VGEVPPVPAILQFPTGRQYLVRSVNGRTVHAVVLGQARADDETDGVPVLPWRWATRKRAA
jgi:hypothetical protein